MCKAGCNRQLLGSEHKFSLSCLEAAKKKDKASEAEPDSKPKPVAFGCEAIGSHAVHFSCHLKPFMRGNIFAFAI